MIEFLRPVVLIAIVPLFFSSLVIGQPSKVELVREHGGYKLTSDGKPFFIKGAGGDHSKPQLKAAGAISFRTWGVGDET